MKKIGILLILLTIISCGKDAKIDYVIVSGKVTNKKIEGVNLTKLDNSLIKTIMLSEDGTFVDTLRIEEGSFMITDGMHRANLYLSPGANIVVNYDVNDFYNTLSFSGKGSEASNYFLLKNKKSKELLGNGTEMFLLEEAAYKAKMNEVKTAMDKLLDDSSEFTEEFINREKKYNNFEYLANIEKYESYHAHYAQKEGFKVSDDFLSEVNSLDYNNEKDFKASDEYKKLVINYYTKKANELALKDNITNEIAFLKTAGTIQNETIKNDLIYFGSKFNITYTNDLENFYKAFMSVATNEKHIKEITDSYNGLKSVAKGQPSPKFVDYENYKGGTTSLDDLKGKFVYIDVWATWCGPCIAEIPALKEVETKYHGKNIAFVSISVDDAKDHDKWKKMIEDEDLKGIQLFADKSWKSDFVTGYLIKGIPRFILIDPKGNIISSNAPRPSDKKLIDLFKENKI